MIETCENDAGTYQQVAKNWKLLPDVPESAWDLKDHLAKDEHAVLPCNGLSRFRITAPAGVDSTFNILRPKPVSQSHGPQAAQNSNDVRGWEVNSDTDDVDEVAGKVGNDEAGDDEAGMRIFRKCVAAKCVNSICATVTMWAPEPRPCFLHDCSGFRPQGLPNITLGVLPSSRRAAWHRLTLVID